MRHQIPVSLWLHLRLFQFVFAEVLGKALALFQVKMLVLEKLMGKVLLSSEALQ